MEPLSFAGHIRSAQRDKAGERARHPHPVGQVGRDLSGHAGAQQGFSGSSDPYTGYYRDRSAGVIGEMHVDDRLPTKELVLGAGFDSQPKAFPHTVLVESGLVNDFVADQPVLVYFDPITATALAFDRTLDGQELTFELSETDDGVYLVDDQTGTKWVPFTGQALDGELAGNALRRVHAVNVFWFAWTDFFPDSEVFGIP